MCKNNSETWFQIFAFFILPVGGQTNRWWPYWTRTYPSSWHLPVQLPSLVSTICMAFSAQQRDIWQHRGQSHSQNNLVSFHREEKFLKKKVMRKEKKTQPCSSCPHSARGNISIRVKVSGLFLAVSCPFFKKQHSSCDASCPLFLRGEVLKSEWMFSMSIKHNSVNVQPELQIHDRGYPSHDQNMISRIINDSHAVKATNSIPWGKVVQKTKSQVSFQHCLNFNVTPGCCGA